MSTFADKKEDAQCLRDELLQILRDEIEKLASQHADWAKVFQSLTPSRHFKEKYQIERDANPVELTSLNQFHLNNLPEEFLKPLLYVHQSKSVPVDTLGKIHHFAKSKLQTPIKEVLLEMIGKYIANAPTHVQQEIKSDRYWKKILEHPDTLGYIAISDHLKGLRQ